MTHEALLAACRRFGLILALAAATLMTLAPSGYMLKASADTGVTVALCGGGDAHIALSIERSDDQAPAREHDDRAAPPACAFAMMGAAALTAPPQRVALDTSTVIDADPGAEPLQAGVAAPVRPPLPARGPPMPA
ncbi:MAG: hypothetical protein GC189_06805 [Alphaproteobacteria bacterium]|nr:hypothetical protein [Alphaproteobacteria bacterium]